MKIKRRTPRRSLSLLVAFAILVAPLSLFAAHYNLGAFWKGVYEFLGYQGSGADGALTVNGTTNGPTNPKEINSYSYDILATANSGATSVTISDNSKFNPGDEILLIQMEGTGVGKYEFKPISTVSGDGITVTFATGILNTYTVDATPSRAQVVLVHQYTTVTVNSGGFLTVGAWDGTKGGVLVFRATGAVTINDGGGALSGSISVKGKGMRAGTIGSNGNGQGKGLAMGGGGTNLTPGSVERLIAAGSGAGSTTAASTGHAGGIIIIKTNSDFNLNGSYTTSYNDDTGQTGAGGVIAQGRVTTGANSGGGAGGTVYIVANNFKTTASCGTVKVDGGAGNGSGVAGGSGRIFIRYKTTLSCSSAGGPANVTTYQKFTEK